jgi:hypothetical protein
MTISKTILSLSLLLSFSKAYPMMIAARTAMAKESPTSFNANAKLYSTIIGDEPLPLIIPKSFGDIEFERFGRKMREWEYPNSNSERIRRGDLKSLQARWNDLSEHEKANFRSYVTTSIPEMNYGLRFMSLYAHAIIRNIEYIDAHFNQNTRQIMSIPEKNVLAIPHVHAQRMKLLTAQLGQLAFCAHAYDRIVSQTFIDAHNKDLEGLATK